MPRRQSNKAGLILLAVIVVAVLAVCLYAYMRTGDQDLETRFANAVGIQAPSDSGDSFSILGFNVEGNNLSYVIILALLIVIAAAVYVKFRV